MEKKHQFAPLAKALTILLVPFFISALIFGFLHLCFEVEMLRALAFSSEPIFKHTSIYRAYLSTKDGRILYYWVFWFFAAPAYLLMAFALALRFKRAPDWTAMRISMKARLGSAVFAAFILLMFFGYTDMYISTGAGTTHWFRPNIHGYIAYSFAYQTLCIFTLSPVIRGIFQLLEKNQ